MGSRAGAEAKTKTRKAYGDDVNDGFGGVRKNGRGMGHEIGRELANQHRKANSKREAHSELRGLHRMLASVLRRGFFFLLRHGGSPVGKEFAS